MKEEWRDIKGFEGKYMVSNLGRFKSLNYRRTGKEKILEGYPDKDGYLYVQLWKDGKVKNCRINRLVAQAFLENPQNLPEVNHKDEDKTNNRVENLEWCTTQYNIKYGTGIKRRAEKLKGRKLSEEHKKKIAEKLKGRKQSEEHIKKRAEKMTNNPKLSIPVIGINKVSKLILKFPSLCEASRQLNINQSHIWECCKGKRKSAGGFYWFYADDNE